MTKIQYTAIELDGTNTLAKAQLAEEMLHHYGKVTLTIGKLTFILTSDQGEGYEVFMYLFRIDESAMVRLDLSFIEDFCQKDMSHKLDVWEEDAQILHYSVTSIARQCENLNMFR